MTGKNTNTDANENLNTDNSPDTNKNTAVTNPGKKIKNPHDRAFEFFFNDIEVARSFLIEYLPEKVKKSINFKKMRLTNKSFIDKKMKRSHSDLLYEVMIKGRLAYIYVLFEHKSWIEWFVALQVLRYMVEIWEEYIRNHKKVKYLPIIIPVVIYHGEPVWDIGDQFSSVFEKNEELKQYIPDFKYNIYDITHMVDEEIKGKAPLQIILMTFKCINAREINGYLERVFRLLETYKDQKKLEDTFDALMSYLEDGLTQLSSEELSETVLKAIEKGGKKMNVVARKLMNKGKEEGIQLGIQKGIQKGIQEGIHKGKEEGFYEITRKAIEAGLDMKTISKITGFTVKQIKAIKDSLNRTRMETLH